MLHSDYIILKPEFDLIIEKIMNREAHLSFSSLKAFMQSPRSFFEYKMCKKTSDAMDKGTQFHLCCLEFEKYQEKYFIFDDTDKYNEIGGKSPRSTTKYKEWKSKFLFEKAEQGKEIIDLQKDKLFKSMKDYLRVNTLTSPYFQSIKETEKDYNFVYNGFKFKSKIDIILNSGHTADLKKTTNALPHKMSWTIRDMLYDLQGAIYAIAVNTDKHYIISIDPSHNTSVFVLEDDNMILAKEKLNYALSKFTECAETDSWSQGSNFFQGNNPEILTVL